MITTEYLKKAHAACEFGMPPDEVRGLIAELHRLQSLNAKLLAACEAWVAVFDDLMRTSDPDDPLTKLRFKYHGEREAMTRAAIAKAKGTP